ncbi:hypothetical protein GWI33_021259 [Rhynchophorus ferrugineus]|uniref:Uncharacterized protein n=1 Tax=Rhynchophorus ferrugineus TaxID=354439 RepID=A0A834HMY7_RHYFE|nr:hypothetical protein GWI33_021259 [Rhynchophorus ferrugineus]
MVRSLMETDQTSTTAQRPCGKNLNGTHVPANKFQRLFVVPGFVLHMQGVAGEQLSFGANGSGTEAKRLSVKKGQVGIADS